VKQARQEAEFRGTSRYASLAAHNCQDLGRVDDLWSLFYVMLEFITVLSNSRHFNANSRLSNSD